MTKFARLNAANSVIETFEHATILPTQTHVPGIAAQFIECPGFVGYGSTLENGVWSDPVISHRIAENNVSPPVLKFRFTSAERVAVRSSRSTDPVLDDFFELLDDQRLATVDLNSQQVKDAISYTINVVGKKLVPAYTPDIILSRVTSILTGV